MVAVNTGSNGMFMFLSLGLALVVVSGILSESTILHGTARQFSSKSIVADLPFALTVYAINGHRHVSLYGLEFELHSANPTFRFLRDTPHAIGQGSILTMAPDSTKPCECQCTGLPRGRYSELTLVVKTNFPFGFINKFKSIKITGVLVSAPATDEALFQTLNREFRTELAQLSDEVEFHTHVPYQGAMGSRHIDWKKSAGRPAHLWVVKDYRSTSADFSLLIRSNWTLIRHSTTLEEYEFHLKSIRTACALAERYERNCYLETMDGQFVYGADKIVAYIASLPHFFQRGGISEMTVPDIPLTREVSGVPIVLEISGKNHQWGGGVRSVKV